VIDEAQDLTELYYNLSCEIIKNNTFAKLCIMGDRFQSIYQFNGADAKYITSAEKWFGLNTYLWNSDTLSISYRMTKNTIDFVNKCVLKNERIKASPVKEEGPKVDYYSINIYKNISVIINEIKTPDDIFILAPSLKESKSGRSTPVRELVNKLTEMKIPIYIASANEREVNKNVLKGKIHFSTFHQAKGLERKHVIVFGFDTSYFKYYNKTSDHNICPNTIYVALTRAITKLTIIRSLDFDHFPFLDMNLLGKYANVHSVGAPNNYRPRENNSKNISVTSLTDYLPSNIIYQAYDMLNIKLIQDKKAEIKIESVIHQGEFCENVSNLTGMFIPAYYEYHKNGRISIYENLCQNLTEIKRILGQVKLEKDPRYQNLFPEYLNFWDYYNKTRNIEDKNKKEFSEIRKDYEKYIISHFESDLNIPKFLKIINLYDAFISGYYYKLNQIQKYDWINDEKLNLCVERLSQQISGKSEFEVSIGKTFNLDEKEITINGSIDCINSENVWEFKTVTNLGKEHFIQLACYAYLLEIEEKTSAKNRKYFLYNILSDEKYEIIFEKEKIKKMIDLLLSSKFSNNISGSVFKKKTKIKFSSKDINDFNHL